RIEPTTGQIVNGTEQIFQFYAQDDEEAEEIASEEGREREAQELNRTAMRYDAQWDEDTMATQMGSAKDSKGMLNMAGTIAPWVVGIIGVILIALGLITYRRA
ncbi:porin PorA family protein, partial [uncultured Corynebacterium sp.]|uniref:porin PorA family protein n=1 Tax=uncultured Corynebacterium sp. TaxID=159447 RepID=UPI0026215C9C